MLTSTPSESHAATGNDLPGGPQDLANARSEFKLQSVGRAQAGLGNDAMGYGAQVILGTRCQGAHVHAAQVHPGP